MEQSFRSNLQRPIAAAPEWPAQHVVISLETLGTYPSCPILSLGATCVGKYKGVYRRSGAFYTPISLADQLNKGFVVGASTINWWMNESDDRARESLNLCAGTDLRRALYNFAAWFKNCACGGSAANLYLWGNGSEFDNAILGYMYHKEQMFLPWTHKANQSLRTITHIAKLFGFDIRMDVPTIRHYALHTAIAEADYLIKVLNALEKLNVATMVSSQAGSIV